MQLTGKFIYLNRNDAQLRLNAIYKNTHFAVRAYDSSGNVLYFDGVQPVIDVTGRSSDSFTRIQANLEPTYSDSDITWWPEYAIETAGKVCKDIDVFYDDGNDKCSYQEWVSTKPESRIKAKGTSARGAFWYKHSVVRLPHWWAIYDYAYNNTDVMTGRHKGDW